MTTISTMGCKCGPGGSREAALRPVVQIHDARVVGKRHQKVGGGGAGVAHHDAGNDECALAAYKARNGKYDAHGGKRSRKCYGNREPRAHDVIAAKHHNHGESYGQARTGGNTQHKGVGDGVGEECLEQKAREGERPTKERGGEDAGKANLPEYPPSRFGTATQEQLGDVGRCGGNRPGAEAC